MEVYLDNSATTQCSQSVGELMLSIMTQDFGNPSSMHQKGINAEKYIREAKENFAHILKVNEKEIYFTSGGTESNNLAIIGTALANQRKGKHLITTKIEHPSVKNPLKYLEEIGYEITWLSVDAEGIVNLKELEQSIREDTTLVSIMHVNNEIGSVQPLNQIAEIIQKKNSQAYFHVDAVQGFGKFRIYPKRIGIDMLSISGHKFHGPKGIGAAYIGERVKLQPILFGGGQQNNLRSGTENVAGIAGISLAAKECYNDLEAKMKHLYEIRESFIKELCAMDDVRINGPAPHHAAPHIVSASFLGVGSEVLLHALEEKGIYVSAGSACATHKKTDSDTLMAIGLDKKAMEGTIRFSFSQDITKGEIEYCADQIRAMLPILRKYKRF